MASTTAGDLLAAAALALAELSAFYAIAAPAIDTALQLPVERQALDQGLTKKKLKKFLWGRAIPLSLATTVVALLLAPVAVQLAQQTYRALTGPASSTLHYDPVGAMLLATWIGLTAVACTSLITLAKLSAKIRGLGPPS